MTLLRTQGIDAVTKLPGSQIAYPAIQYWLEEGDEVRWADVYVDLLNPSWTDAELAGMGLQIIGNVVRCLHDKTVSPMADAFIELWQGPTASMAMPWPGMPTDAPLQLDLTQMPFDPVIFFDGEGHGKYRVDRLALMRVIEKVWVPYLVGILRRRA